MGKKREAARELEAQELPAVDLRRGKKRKAATELESQELQDEVIKVKVVKPGQSDVEYRFKAPQQVSEVLAALNLTGRLENSAKLTLTGKEVMQGGQYTLFSAEPLGAMNQTGLIKAAELTAFWSALAKAKEKTVNGATYLVLKKRQFPFVGPTIQSRLLIRQSYRWLWDYARDYLLKKGEDGKQMEYLIFMLRGNPGIGKSLFLYYVMHFLAATGQTVVLQQKATKTVVFTKEGAFEGFKNEAEEGFSSYLKDPETWYLVDAISPSLCKAKTLFVTSPDEALTKQALKRTALDEKWMDVWSVSKELVPAGKHLFGIEEADVRKRARKFGPIPRHVLQGEQKTKRKELAKAINTCGLEDLQTCLLDPGRAPKYMSHRLVIVEVEEDYEEGTTSFASAHIEAELAAKLERQSRHKMKVFFRATSGVPAVHSLRGCILERTHAHEVLQNGGHFRCRDLDTHHEEWMELDRCAARENLKSYTAIGSLQPGVYGKGMYEHNLGGVDAVVKPGKLFQITVSERHKIKMPAMATVVAQMGGVDNLKLYWVVDELTFTPDFRKQPFIKTKDVTAAVAREVRGIKQYLLQLPSSIHLMAAHQDSDTENTVLA